LPRRGISGKYRFALSFVSITFISFDFGLFLSFSGGFEYGIVFLFAVYVLGLFPTQVFVCVYFIKEAIYIRTLVWCHLTRRDVQARESNAARSLQRLGRTAFWLLMSSLAITFSLISNVLVLLTPMTILENVPELAVSPISYCILVASSVFFRVSISYTQIRAIRKNDSGVCGKLPNVYGLLARCRTARILAEDPTEGNNAARALADEPTEGSGSALHASTVSSLTVPEYGNIPVSSVFSDGTLSVASRSSASSY